MQLSQGTVAARRGDARFPGKPVGTGVLDQESKGKKQYDRPQLEHASTISRFPAGVNGYFVRELIQLSASFLHIPFMN